MNAATFIEFGPAEIILLILKHLSINDLSHMCLVNKTIRRRFCDHDTNNIWEYLISDHLSPGVQKSLEPDCKYTYKTYGHLKPCQYQKFYIDCINNMTKKENIDRELKNYEQICHYSQIT